MWLFLVSQTANSDYETFDSFVTVAVDSDEARKTYPQTNWRRNNGPADIVWVEGPEYTGWVQDGNEFYSYNWVNNLEDVKVECIGEALVGKGQTKGIVCASYNAG